MGGAARMRALINDLLDYSRVGSRPLNLTRTDTGVVLDAVRTDLSAAIRESGAVVTNDPLPVVLADAVQVGQLFSNLISNAIKFRSQAPPRVHVSAEWANGRWCFAVSDNGIGIDPRYQERILRHLSASAWTRSTWNRHWPRHM